MMTQMNMLSTISRQKAYTAVSFNGATSTMEDRFTKPFSVGKVEGLVFSAGGVPITAGGTLYGAIGVSGAPSGETDERCARAGVEAITAEPTSLAPAMVSSVSSPCLPPAWASSRRR